MKTLKTLLTTAFLLVALVATSQAAITTSTLVATSGTVQLVTDAIDTDGGRLSIYTFNWTSTSGGKVLATVPLIGRIVRATFAPGATTPTDGYDVTLVDQNSVDILLGLGANALAASATTYCPVLGNGTDKNQQVTVWGRCTLMILAAGSAKTGTIVLYILR